MPEDRYEVDAMADEYAVSPENRVRQLREKAAYDRQTVHGILDSALHASVGFVEDGRPVVVPMIFGRDGETLYLHGARKARVVRWLDETRRACVNVTLVDGLVFARSAFNSSLNYRSVTVFGAPRLVDSDDEKLKALEIISEHTMPGRWAELRAPLEKELKMTGVIALEIESASAKVATGMPEDEEEDYDIPVWAGVLPVTTRTGELDTDPLVPDGIEPGAAVRALQHRQI
ncbi:MAG: pyridoxamine 5'-phosphate oxidase family protein [Woeseiaceae bacterium]|nr:pyridoxamine 5'-phosphate oxidase family protein [Woeseiaceae bacterium]